MQTSPTSEQELELRILAEAIVGIFKGIQRDVKKMCDDIDSCLEYCRNYQYNPADENYQ